MNFLILSTTIFSLFACAHSSVAKTDLRRTASAPVGCPNSYVLQKDCEGNVTILDQDLREMVASYQVALCLGGGEFSMGIAYSESLGGRMTFFKNTVVEGSKVTAYVTGNTNFIAGELVFLSGNAAKFRNTNHRVDMTCQ